MDVAHSGGFLAAAVADPACRYLARLAFFQAARSAGCL